MKHYLRLARPFTLLPPLLGIVSGAICPSVASVPSKSQARTWNHIGPQPYQWSAGP